MENIFAIGTGITDDIDWHYTNLLLLHVVPSALMLAMEPPPL